MVGKVMFGFVDSICRRNRVLWVSCFGGLRFWGLRSF